MTKRPFDWAKVFNGFSPPRSKVNRAVTMKCGRCGVIHHGNVPSDSDVVIFECDCGAGNAVPMKICEVT